MLPAISIFHSPPSPSTIRQSVSMPSGAPTSRPQVAKYPFTASVVTGSDVLVASSADMIAYSEGTIGVSTLEMNTGDGSAFVRRVCSVASDAEGVMSSSDAASSTTVVKGRWRMGNRTFDTAPGPLETLSVANIRDNTKATARRWAGGTRIESAVNREIDLGMMMV